MLHAIASAACQSISQQRQVTVGARTNVQNMHQVYC